MNENESIAGLREQFAIEKVVFDELELDDFVHLLSTKIYRHLSSVTPGWRELPRRIKREIYRRQIRER